MDKNTRIINYEGVLNLNDVAINCYVLEDGTRVLSSGEMQRALKIVDINTNGVQPFGTRLERYLNQKNLFPFLYEVKKEGHYNPIVCYKKGKKIHGYEATILIDICDAFLKARKEIDLSQRQQIIADQCEILVRSFAKIRLIALIDEATRYQYKRGEKELQTILKTLVYDEIMEYRKQFPLSFYKEIFRLWDIPFLPKYIKRKPRFIGIITNKYIYNNLPKGHFVLKKLKSQTPKNEKGEYKYRLHQSLTPEKGIELLKKTTYSVETLASVSKNKHQFEQLINQKYNGQLPLLPEFN